MAAVAPPAQETYNAYRSMSELSPVDASLLALIAENHKSPSQVRKLLRHTSRSARGIAESIITPATRKRVSKADRRAAEAIRHWAATNDR